MQDTPIWWSDPASHTDAFHVLVRSDRYGPVILDRPWDGRDAKDVVVEEWAPFQPNLPTGSTVHVTVEARELVGDNRLVLSEDIVIVQPYSGPLPASL
jgi:glyoxylate carboligase